MIIDDRNLADSGAYYSHLTKFGKIYVNMDRAKKGLSAFEQKVETLRYLMGSVVYFETGGAIFPNSKNDIYTYLTKYAGCPEHYFQTRDTVGFSLNSSKVLVPLKSKGYATEFLDYYIQHASLKKQLSDLMGLDRVAKLTETPGPFGDKLSMVQFEINEKTNQRFYYKNYNILGVPKRFLFCIEPPKGYIMVGGDFEQSDLRIAYNMMLRTKDNMPTVLKFNDMYEAFYSLAMGDEYDHDTFVEHRNSDIKENTLATIYGQAQALTPFAQMYCKKLQSYLSNNEVYSEYKKRIATKIELDMPVVVKSYFGFNQMVYGYNSGKVMNESLNYPVQCGSSEIVIKTVNSIMDKFAEVGVTEENGGIYVYFTRHDEPIFLLKEEHINKTRIFAEHEQILVKGWTPLSIKFTPMYCYGVEEKSLIDLFRKDYANAKLDEYIYNPEEIVPYIPTEDIFELYVHHVVCNGEVTLILLNPKTKAHWFGKIPPNVPIDMYMEKYINTKSPSSCNVVYFRTAIPEKIIRLPKYISFSNQGDSEYYAILDELVQKVYERFERKDKE